ncbi:hypothetical protein [Pseudoalteromonas denitrificans]|uniref:Uncharacterized protein n=1 Tax=Pseudoalteromonas denitrificans DSM 6059 TaxID=1123010 RepID=A0A1I1PHK9_9GAMM|nr:hypothetical protein [Pseudoalteromonas denitrificans]SFD09287.1 hypothetical protein SAMN02745724_03447 [Pseudoalteromonas denitrificans DSM 6059]
MELQELNSKRDGEALFALYHEGNFDAGLLAAKLVFNDAYKLTPPEGMTKKEAKDKLKKDAQSCVITGADNNHLECLIEAADMHFSGRVTPGPFGSSVVLAQYKHAKKWYLLILERDEIDSELRCLANLRLGLLTKLIGGKDNTDWQEMIGYFKAAQEIAVKGSELAISSLAFHYFDNKEYAAAIPLLESIYREVPYAALILALCYKNGLGLDVNNEKAQELNDFWSTEIGKAK